MFNLESDKQLQRIVNANRSKEIFRWDIPDVYFQWLMEAYILF